MISAKQVRIGNTVAYAENDAIKKELWGTPRSFKAADFQYLDFYDPIPLSPEVLKDFGFEIEKTSRHEWPMHKISNVETVYEIGDIDGSDWFQVKEVNNDGSLVYNCSVKANLKHLHQLQNLYFALTGEELTYKLA